MPSSLSTALTPSCPPQLYLVGSREFRYMAYKKKQLNQGLSFVTLGNNACVGREFRGGPGWGRLGWAWLGWAGAGQAGPGRAGAGLGWAGWARPGRGGVGWAGLGRAGGRAAVDLSSVGLTARCVGDVADLVRLSPQLERLHVDGNAIGSEGVTMLAAAMKEHRPPLSSPPHKKVRQRWVS